MSAKLSAMLAPALEYAARGYYVFPCRPRKKKPLTKNGFLDATVDTEQITKWWTANPKANLAIAGAMSRIVVFDIDRHTNRLGHLVDGFKTLAALVEKLGKLPETVTAQTGGGGMHYVFAAPADVQFKGILGPGVEIKHLGYIVVEPSIHPSGNLYRWIISPFVRMPAPLPDAWLARMLKPTAPKVANRSPVMRTTVATRYGRVAAERELERVRTAPEGDRNCTLNTAACKLGALCAGGELGDCCEELIAAGMSAGLPEYEARATTESGWRAGLRRPRASQTRGMYPMMSRGAQ